MRVSAVAAAVGVLVLAGCGGGPTGDDTASSPAPSRASSSETSGDTASPTTASPTTAVPTTASPTGTPTAGASVAAPSDPVVEAGNAGAWTLTRATPGAEQSRQVPTLQCGQDGSVTADGLSLTAGAGSLTLTDPAVTVTGTASLDAGGGTFRGRDADTAVVFTWIC